MNDDELFFERLRRDAAVLRHEPDEAALARVRARVRARVNAPSLAQLLAAWLRPLAAGLAAVALAAGIGIATMDDDGDAAGLVEPVEIVMAGDSYSVGN